jgi:hypothetical protein
MLAELYPGGGGGLYVQKNLSASQSDNIILKYIRKCFRSDFTKFY